MQKKPQSSAQSNLRDVYNVVFRHQKKGIILFIVIFLLVSIGTYFLPEFYKSDAKIMIKLGRESVGLDATAATNQAISINMPREYEINSELEILRSRQIAENVVEEIGMEQILYKPDTAATGVETTEGQARDRLRSSRKRVRSLLSSPRSFLQQLDLVDEVRDFDKATLAVMNNFAIRVKKNSNIIDLSYEARKPELAQKILRKLVEFYLKKHIDVYRTHGSNEFFAVQVDTFRRQLQATEDRISELKNRTGIADLVEYRTNLMNRINGLTLQIYGGGNVQDGISGLYYASEAKAKVLGQNLAKTPQKLEMSKRNGVNNSAYGFMKQSLYQLQLREQELLSKYTEENPYVIEIQRQIKEAENLISKENKTHTEVVNGVNETYQQIKIQLYAEKANAASLKAKLDELKKQLKTAQNELKKFSSNENELLRLQRMKNIQESSYLEYVRKEEETRIDHELETKQISNISVVQEASYPMTTSRPNKIKNIILGFFFAIFGGLGIAFLTEYLDDTIKSPEDVISKLQLNTLIVIAKYPKFKTK